MMIMTKPKILFLLTISAICFIFFKGVFCGGTPGEDKKKESFPEPKIKFAPKHYICYRTNEPIKIDGKLNEKGWQQIEWTDDFMDIEGNLKPKPTFRTRAKILWDDEYIYFAAELEEPHVWATLTQRDTVIFYDNDFEVFIDPDGDTHQYYEFEMNAFGTEWDLFLIKPYRDGGPAMSAWDIQELKTAVYVDGTINDPEDKDKGWSLEIAMPWKVLKECAHRETPPKAGDQWRMNFSRVEWRTEVKNDEYRKIINPETGRSYPEDNWVWSPQGLINMHYPETWGYVQFSDKFAGKGKDTFRMKKEEYAKWVLRQVYYKQRTHYRNFGKYTDNAEKLGLSDFELEAYKLPPTIEITQNLFEATLTSTDGKEKWIISVDGRIWRKAESK